MDPLPEDGLIARGYQLQLGEIAAKKNTIIHLPTGSGKTYIAIELIKRLRLDLQKPWGQGGRRTFFLVNNVPLVEQQKKVISKSCPDSVSGYSSEDGVDYWNKEKWDQELSNNKIIVMTSQILADMITHSYIKIEDINLIIFDECHHAVEDHPMRLVMKHFEFCPVDTQPRVLGLTATLLNANATTLGKVAEDLKCLETTFHATIATVNDLNDVFEYSTNPFELVQFYSANKLTPAGIRAIQILSELREFIITVELPSRRPIIVKLKPNEYDITYDTKKIIKQLKNAINGMISYITELGVYGGTLGILAYIITIERTKRSAVNDQEELLFNIVITQAHVARDVLEEEMKDDEGMKKITRHSSEQVLVLLDILKEYNPKYYSNPKVSLNVNKSRKSLSGIIFTQQRFTSKLLYNIIKEVVQIQPEEYGFLKHDFLTGFAVKPMCTTREEKFNKKCSEKVLNKFNNKQLNLIISTSVIEEGIDVPQCRLVVRFDPPLEYRSYIQSKGRARSIDSSFVMLIKSIDKTKFDQKYNNFQMIENHIQKMLVGSTDMRNEPSANTIEKDLYRDDEIPPYVTSNGARLSAVQAISLLNRYCAVLPHDKLTVITPMLVYKELQVNCSDVLVDSIVEKKGVISIIMPIACPIKEAISGMPCFNKKNAKRSAALNVCKILHQIGELGPVSMLPKIYGAVEFNVDSIRECFPNWPWGNEEEMCKSTPKPGSKKRIRKYHKVFPKAFRGPKSWTSEETEFYLHIIEFEPTYKMPLESREEALYNLLQMKNGYGLITANKLNDICEFPLHLKQGEISTAIKTNYMTLKLSPSLMKEIIRYHHFLFNDVLEIAKKYLVFNGKQNCVFVVPTEFKNGRHEIDWNVIDTYKDIEPPGVPSLQKRKQIHVTRDSYKGAVVTPWYRTSLWPDRYIVSEVLENKTLQSQLGSDQSYNFEEYYAEKHNLIVVGDKHQPMLEVVSITSRYNCLLSRSSKHRSLTTKQQKLLSTYEGDISTKDYAELFVPEFCTKFEYPGSLWYKATLIPAVIHRVSMLLVADDFRRQIASEAKLGVQNLPKGKSWQPITTNLDIEKQSLLSQIEPLTLEECMAEPIDEEDAKPLNIYNSLSTTSFELQQKKLDEQYPWEGSLEPVVDVERNLTTATIMDIILYTEFVTAPLSPVRSPSRDDRAKASASATASPTAPTSASACESRPALLPPPITYKNKIDIFTKTNNGIGPELKDIVAALTTIKSNDTFNLERAETLGDSFLKFAATLYLFHKFPKLNEGQLTNIKGRLIGNRNLFYAGERVNLGGRMKVENFSPRCDFLLPAFSVPDNVKKLMENPPIRPSFMIGFEFTREEILSGELSNASWEKVASRYNNDADTKEIEPPYYVENYMQCYVGAQAAADKTIADCVEALIGTYLLSCGVEGAVGVVEWLRIFPKKDNFLSYLSKPMSTVISEGRSTPRDIDFYLNYTKGDIEKIIKYEFKDSSLLLEAISHPSYIRNRVTNSYERLEFLGDAILDFLITAYIFENFTDLKPGDLTDLRSALVNNVTFASYVVKLGLHKYLGSELSPALMTSIDKFVEHQERRNHEIEEAVLYLIEEEECHVAEYVEVPKVLSDIYEALAGAIYLDCGGDLQVVWDVFYDIMWKEIEAFSKNIPKQPVRLLHERSNAHPEIMKSKATDSDVPRVMVPIRVYKSGVPLLVHGFGSNKFQAKRAAAKLALRLLGD